LNYLFGVSKKKEDVETSFFVFFFGVNGSVRKKKKPGSRKPRDSEESHWGAEAPRRVTYRTVTVGKILQDFKAPPVIHNLSLDMEGSEHTVLQTFPFDVHCVLVITIERPDLCARTILRQQGYLYLRNLAGQDEIWVHPKGSLGKSRDREVQSEVE
jgi:hypothetical protein